MKITDIKIHVVEIPGQQGRILELIQVPGLRRTQYTHQSHPTDSPAHRLIMRVQTDEGVEGICGVNDGAGNPSHMLALLRANVLGEDAFKREHIYQKLQLGTRWVYQKPGWFGAFDNCLWDIAGKAAGLPIHKMIGQVRDGMPIYQTAGDGPLEMYIQHIEQGLELGIRAYKPHSYKGGKADIPIVRGLREHVGPDFDLILDPVCSYSYEEAVEVGHVLEELDFVWLEEPFHEQKMHLYQRLCDELTIPVMANETLMNDVGISAERLINGATDLLRANARNGTTQVLKMAHFAELYSTSIELNGTGGLFGLIHASLGCAIANNDYFEGSVGENVSRGKEGLKIGLMNPPEIVDGCLIPSEKPGWGAEWDMDLLEERTVEVL
ncbi:MAG: enolase C-terminal domain-like protein [Anaerolineae bacterium]